MNRGEQIAREIIGMDKKHTWKYLSLVAASPQAPSKKGISSENLSFRKTLPPVVFCPSKGIPLKKKTLSLWFSQPALVFSCSLFIPSSRFPLFQPSTMARWWYLCPHVPACSAPPGTSPHSYKNAANSPGIVTTGQKNAWNTTKK